MVAAELVYLAVLGISLLSEVFFPLTGTIHYMRGDAFWIYLSAYFHEHCLSASHNSQNDQKIIRIRAKAAFI